MRSDPFPFKYLGIKLRTFLLGFFLICILDFLLFVLEARSLVFGRLRPIGCFCFTLYAKLKERPMSAQS